MTRALELLIVDSSCCTAVLAVALDQTWNCYRLIFERTIYRLIRLLHLASTDLDQPLCLSCFAMADTAESYQQRIKLLEQQLAAERSERSRLASLHSLESNNAALPSSPSTNTDPGSMPTATPTRLVYPDTNELKDIKQPPLVTMKVESAKPEFYYGDDTVNTDIRKVKNVNIWLKQIHRYVGSLPEDQQLRVASGFLRGPAEVWLLSYERGLQKKGYALTFQSLCEGLKERYGSEDQNYVVRQKLEHLKMGTSGCHTLADYNHQFMLLESMLVADEWREGLAFTYTQGLSQELSQWVIRKQCTTLEDAIRTAVSEESIQKRQQLDRSSKPSSATNHTDRSQHRGGYKRRWDNNYRPASSEVNSISAQPADDDQETPSKEPTNSATSTPAASSEQPGSQIAAVQARRGTGGGYRLSQEDRDMLGREGRCFKCHQQGHIKPNCTNSWATAAPKPLK